MDAAVNLLAAVAESAVLTGAAGFAETAGLFDLTQPADDGL